MAWYNIEYSCGHNGKEQVYGKSVSRENYLEWAKNNKVCPDCWQQQKEQERKQKLEKEKIELASARETGCEIPEITKGSEKQIPWAKDIVTKILLKKSIGWVVATLSPENISNAKYWIDRRSLDDVEWQRRGLRDGQWKSQWHKDCGDPAFAAAGNVLRRTLFGPYAHNCKGWEDALKKLKELSVLPIDKAPAFDSSQYDEWLLLSWAHTGLTQWVESEIEKTLSAAQVGKRLDDATEQMREARQLEAQAKAISEDAKQKIENSALNMAMLIGAKGIVDGKIYKVTGVIDEGAAVIAVDTDNEYHSEQFTRSVWINAYKIYRMEYDLIEQ